MSSPIRHPKTLRRQCLLGTAAALLAVAAVATLALHYHAQLDHLCAQMAGGLPAAAPESCHREIAALVSSGYRLIAAAAVGATLVLVGGAVWIGRAILARLDTVAAAAARILAGDYATRLNCASNDEIGTLARQLNELAAALDTRSRHLPEGQPAGRGASTATTSGPRAAGPTRILVVEDGPENRRFMNLVLRKAAIEVSLADNGREAVEKALARVQNGGSPFDLILMDMEMPVMNGYDATRALRQSGYQGRIVAVTGHTRDYDRQKCLEAGCDQYVCKPVDQDTLLALVGAMPHASASAPSKRANP